MGTRLALWPDNERDCIAIEDMEIIVLDGDGERMAIDHSSPEDGYIAFVERGDDGLVNPDGDSVTVQFLERGEA